MQALCAQRYNHGFAINGFQKTLPQLPVDFIKRSDDRVCDVGMQKLQAHIDPLHLFKRSETAAISALVRGYIVFPR